MKKIVIMGASSGIGLSVARALLAADIKLGLAARHTEQFKKLKDEFPGKVEYERIDITEEKASEQLMKLIKKLGGMDIYFHCSGVGHSNPELDLAKEEEIVSVNVGGFARMLATAYCYFRASKRKGQIAAITSVAGTKGLANLAAYSASKSFDQTYMTALDQLAHQQGVDVAFTDIRPGWTDTPMLSGDDSKYPMLMSLPHVTAGVLRAIAMKKRVATVDWRWNVLTGVWRLVPNALWTRMAVDTGDF